VSDLRRGDVGPTGRFAQPVGARAPDSDPFDRMLLSTDGTVTTLLAACTGEPIITRATRQAGPASLDRLLTATGCWWHPDATLLEVSRAERVIARRVTLRGGRSDVAYVLAESLAVPDRLPRRVARGLTSEGASLGRLLTAGPVETRREVLQVTAVSADEAACDHLGVRPGATLAQRTYRIVIGERAAAAVTEWICPGRLAAAALQSHPHRPNRAQALTGTGVEGDAS